MVFTSIVVKRKKRIQLLIKQTKAMPQSSQQSVQAFRSRGGRGGGLPPPPPAKKKVFYRCALFHEEPLKCVLFERSNQKCTWNLIFYTCKLKHNTLLLIRFYQVENIKSLTLFNNIANALGRMDIPLTDRKVRCYDCQAQI